MVRVGIVGVGNTIGIAGNHIDGYLRVPEAKITAVYDIIRERAAGYIEKFGLEGAKACESYEELLDLVDAVSICTPNASHIELTVQALKAGKHVLCEKPFGVDALECQKALNYAEMSGRVCMIGLCYRGIPGYMYLKKLIDDGSLGKIFYIRQSLGGNRIANPQVKLEWRMQKELSGPGAMADFGSHMLDIGDMLIRDTAGPITEVQCMSGIMVEERDRVHGNGRGSVDNDDVAMFTARTRDGVLLSYTASRIGSRHTVEVYGSGGNAVFDGADHFSLQIQKKDPEGGYLGAPECVKVPEEMYLINENVPKTPFAINFYFEIKQFIDAIEKGTPVDTDFQRGIYIQKLIDALQESSDCGCSVPIDFE